MGEVREMNVSSAGSGVYKFRLLFLAVFVTFLGSCGAGFDHSSAEVGTGSLEFEGELSSLGEGIAEGELSGDEGWYFDSRTLTWKVGSVESAEGQSSVREYFVGGQLFQRERGGEAFTTAFLADKQSLLKAGATWDPKSAAGEPTANDVVYVVGEDARHELLAQVGPGEEFAFLGRVFEARREAGRLEIRFTGKTMHRVVDTFERQAYEVVDLDVVYAAEGAADTISGTPEHPFFVPARGDYVPMGELDAGTVLRTTDGSLARVVGSERRQGGFEVFNFEVEDAHNYYVSSPRGSPGVLVHNVCVDRVREVNNLPKNARLTDDVDDVFNRLEKHNGIDPNVASDRLHKIKNSDGFNGDDNVVFDLTGNVFNPSTGELMGTLTAGGAR
ncbi:hypothetical protein DL240_17430 [Lujinxingia litoralis]|uniref:Uncharacterized protein n=1 Tax=Lujinxingia litoralis TaxID=2211119 RepID=A0A328C1R4_9DELT|nr:polymorphic toxin-type HINT domain-containing protein [Lujinxingia litoralis]RAL20363.1 hypothetical protein DL240_17430 [Lujinxingia litoralis]